MERSPFDRGSNLTAAPRPASYSLPKHAERYDEVLDAESYENPDLSSMAGDKKIFAFGVARNRLLQSIKSLGVPAVVVKDLAEADVLLTQRRYYRDRLQPIVEAENRGIPIFVVKSNTVDQIEQFLADSFQERQSPVRRTLIEEAMRHAEQAVMMIQAGEKFINLPPMPSPVRREQHELAKRAHLVSRSFGKDPNRYVRIYRD